MRLRLWYAAQVERFVPPRLRADAEKGRSARLLVEFSSTCVLIGGAFFVLSIVNHRVPLVIAVSGASTLASAFAPLVLRRTGSPAVVTSAMLSVWVAAMILASASSEGQAAQTLPWLAVVPLLATALAGRRAGILWAVACVVLAEAQIASDWGGITPRQVLSDEVRKSGTSWNIALLIVFVLALGLLYETLRLRTTAALSDAYARIEATREKALVADRLASLGQMAAGVAHEINNPMAFVRSNIALLQEDLGRGPLDAKSQREYAEDILPATDEGIRRVIAIVGDLQRFAREAPEGGAEFDLNEEVSATLRMCEGLIGECRLVAVLGDLPRIVGRPRDLGQVAMNLVVNAADAMKGRGEIRVETSSTDEEVVLRVKDDGPGMSAEVKARVFEPFFTTKPVGKGTGLGLAVVHGVVLAHGGSVRVESTPGGGSVFEVRLPRPPRALDARTV